jgi:hypothetical protein
MVATVAEAARSDLTFFFVMVSPVRFKETLSVETALLPMPAHLSIVAIGGSELQ